MSSEDVNPDFVHQSNEIIVVFGKMPLMQKWHKMT